MKKKKKPERFMLFITLRSRWCFPSFMLLWLRLCLAYVFCGRTQLTSQQFHHCLESKWAMEKEIRVSGEATAEERSATLNRPLCSHQTEQTREGGRETKYWGLEGSAWGLQSRCNHKTCKWVLTQLLKSPQRHVKKVAIKCLSWNILKCFWYHKIFSCT